MTEESRRRSLAWSGVAVAAGGGLTILLNVVFTPLLQTDVPYAEMAASSAFLWRQSLSALAAVLLLGATGGLYRYHAHRSGRFGAFAFVLAFVGSALLVAHEWNQIFFVHELARRSPETLNALEAASGPSLFDLGAMIAFVTFALGWITFSVSLLLGGVFSRRGPLLVIAGFFAVPVLSAALPQVWGMILGNVVLGSGWILLGRELRVPRPTAAQNP